MIIVAIMAAWPLNLAHDSRVWCPEIVLTNIHNMNMNIAEQMPAENTGNGNPEEWRPVVGFEGAYEVSSHGAIRRTGQSKKLRPEIYNGGYHCMSFRRHGKRFRKSVHSVVARAFIGERPAGAEINHKRGIKTDNRASELEYVTGAENMRHAYKNGLCNPARGERSGISKLKESEVLEIRAIHKTGNCSLMAIANSYGVGYSTIRAILMRRTWNHI